MKSSEASGEAKGGVSMISLRRWRFPVLIGGGIVAAGTLFYFAGGHVNSRATQGTIAHRDVYRDGDIKPGDVGTPGTAPVAVKAVLESKDFQKLAKNQAFQGLMNDQAFQVMAKNGAFWGLLQSQTFATAMRNGLFLQAVQNRGVMASMQSSQAHGMDAGLRNELLASNVSGLANSSNFNKLLNDSSFRGLLHESAFTHLLASHEFQALMGNASFLTLASSAGFQNALMSGSVASLNAAMSTNLSSSLARE